LGRAAVDANTGQYVFDDNNQLFLSNQADIDGITCPPDIAANLAPTSLHTNHSFALRVTDVDYDTG
jgi:hypothetical protein